ncbi:MAG TPA: GIY-YIG nuclease family protein [Nostocaceae cyanobacterium]|nr:GIY-YIG nuclease family protein [Nostocaceae cyanobacterium]
MSEYEQISLNLGLAPKTSLREKGLVLSVDALMEWKQRIFNYQQQVRESQPIQQKTLIEITPNHCDPETIEPFSLHLQSMSFFRMPDPFGQAALYFVLDSSAQLILYIGETIHSNKRWRGVHDCKSYIAAYQDLHYRYQMQTAVNIGFWWDAPTERKPRQQLEQQLIRKWRSPFNKEMWDLWGQPFKAVK